MRTSRGSTKKKYHTLIHEHASVQMIKKYCLNIDNDMLLRARRDEGGKALASFHICNLAKGVFTPTKNTGNCETGI